MSYNQSKRSQILKVIGWSALGIVVLVSAVIAWAIWPQTIVPVNDFAALHPQGMIVIHPDPTDPQFNKLVQDLIAKTAPDASSQAKWIADLLPKAILHEVVILSFYDKDTRRESVVGTVQLRRFGGILMGFLRQVASRRPEMEITPAGLVRLPGATFGSPSVSLQREGLIASNNDERAGEVSRMLATGRKRTKRGEPDADDREMIKKMLIASPTGQVQGYMVNEPGRLKRFLQTAANKGWIRQEDADLFTEATLIKTIEDSVVGAAIGGELQADGSLKITVLIPVKTGDRTELLKNRLERDVLSKLNLHYYASKFEIRSENTVVYIEGVLPNFRAFVLEPLFQGALP